MSTIQKKCLVSPVRSVKGHCRDPCSVSELLSLHLMAAIPLMGLMMSGLGGKEAGWKVFFYIK